MTTIKTTRSGQLAVYEAGLILLDGKTYAAAGSLRTLSEREVAQMVERGIDGQTHCVGLLALTDTEAQAVRYEDAKYRASLPPATPAKRSMLCPVCDSYCYGDCEANGPIAKARPDNTPWQKGDDYPA